MGLADESGTLEGKQEEDNQEVNSSSGRPDDDRRLFQPQSDTNEGVNQSFHLDVEQPVQGTSSFLGTCTRGVVDGYEKSHVDRPLDGSRADSPGSQELEIVVGEIEKGKQVVLGSNDGDGSPGIQDTLDPSRVGASMESETHGHEASSQSTPSVEILRTGMIEKPKRGLKLEIRKKDQVEEIHLSNADTPLHCSDVSPDKRRNCEENSEGDIYVRENIRRIDEKGHRQLPDDEENQTTVRMGSKRLIVHENTRIPDAGDHTGDGDERRSENQRCGGNIPLDVGTQHQSLGSLEGRINPSSHSHDCCEGEVSKDNGRLADRLEQTTPVMKSIPSVEELQRKIKEAHQSGWWPLGVESNVCSLGLRLRSDNLELHSAWVRETENMWKVFKYFQARQARKPPASLLMIAPFPHLANVIRAKQLDRFLEEMSQDSVIKSSIYAERLSELINSSRLLLQEASIRKMWSRMLRETLENLYDCLENGATRQEIIWAAELNQRWSVTRWKGPTTSET